MKMKLVLLALLSMFLTLPLMAQVEDLVGGGIAWNQYAAPQIGGNLFYAHRIGETTYNFNLVDVVSKTVKPFTVAVSITPGLAQQILNLNGKRIYILSTAGVAAGGQNLGFAWSAGGCAIIPIGRGWSIMPNVRALKSVLSDYQAIYGIAVGWGK